MQYRFGRFFYMAESKVQQADTRSDTVEVVDGKDEQQFCYRIRFRREGQEYTARGSLSDLAAGDPVMVSTDHNPEPAVIVCRAAGAVEPGMDRGVSYQILRRATREEEEKYARLSILEKEAFDICRERIQYLRLPMHLVRVERFFNGSKIIFYFTAESRVDFRELVKKLVQEFRTRVEMRQIGVRHETQMTGGIGACGRELCCTSFLNKFESVSIKMAKTQDLPLNPAKISGVCNRLLCCLTYEYDAYKAIKREMPRIGRLLKHEGEVYRVIRLHPLQNTVQAFSREAGEVLLTEEQWRAAEPVHKKLPRKQNKGRKNSNRK
jgi:cell fate regulator YaaT (PSP1 superfamily)